MDATEAERFISELELAVDRLRSLYEQYFMGIEKLEPTVPRKDVDRRIHALRKDQIRNTAQRFRFQMVLQRYNTYQSYWQRICREIENGTYKRHVMRARQRFGESTGVRESSRPPLGAPVLGPALAAELAELDREFGVVGMASHAGLDIDSAFGRSPPPGALATPPNARRGAPPPLPLGANAPRPSSLGRAVSPGMSAEPPALPRPTPPPARTAPAVPPPVSGGARRDTNLPDARVRELYNQYVEAKRRQNESTASVTYEAVARTLSESGARLRQKHGKSVDFEVAVRDGRAVLKPVLR